MYIIFYTLILIAAVLLILIVLVQNSKGGGLTNNFSSSQQMMGVRKTTDFLEKATWTLAGGLIVLSILASLTIQKPEEYQKKSKIEEQMNTEMNLDQLPDNLPQEPSDE